MGEASVGRGAGGISSAGWNLDDDRGAVAETEKALTFVSLRLKLLVRLGLSKGLVVSGAMLYSLDRDLSEELPKDRPRAAHRAEPDELY